MGPGATVNLSRPVGLGLKVLDSFHIVKAIEIVIVAVTVVAIVTVRVLRIQIGIEATMIHEYPPFGACVRRHVET